MTDPAPPDQETPESPVLWNTTTPASRALMPLHKGSISLLIFREPARARVKQTTP